MTMIDGFAVYLLAGILALLLLELTTGRISRNLKNSSYATQEILAKASLTLPLKVALIITAVALWLFWPLAIYGAIETAVKGALHNTKEEEHDKDE